MAEEKYYTEKEEIANSVSHLLGILLGIVGGYYLITKAEVSSIPWALGCVITYLCGMLCSYISSSWYHATTVLSRKRYLRKWDHAAIYIHIAASYTPFTLLILRDVGYWGYGLFAFTWLAAIVGTLLSFYNLKRHSHLETICFVLMGCIILVAIKSLWTSMDEKGCIHSFYWLIGGGISYIVGALFYSMYKIKYMHTVFHLFILGGSVCHLIAIGLIL